MINEEKIIEAAVKYNVENYSQIDNDFQNALNITSVKSFVAGAKWAINLKEDLKEKIMNTDYVTFEIAKNLKEKGFKEKCIWHYYDDTKDIYQSSVPQCYNYGGNTSDAPTISQVLKWLREEKNIHIEIYCSASGYEYIIQDTPNLGGSDIRFSDEDGDNDAGCWDTYEEAVLAGIEYVLNNLI